MSKTEETMKRLREQHEQQTSRNAVKPPHWDIRQRLAIVLMRTDGQVNCKNCIYRLRPCRAYQHCLAPDRPHFQPKQSLMDMQLKRVSAILEEIKNI